MGKNSNHKNFKSNRSSKNRKYNGGKFNRRCDTSTDAGNLNHSTNDVAWYIQDDQMLRDVASFNFPYRTGNEFNFNPRSETSSDTDIKTIVPGIMRLDYVPTVGKPGDDSSYTAANLAAQEIYSFIRHRNSGSRNYDPADMMMYLLTMDGVYSMYSWMIRLYGILRLYTYKNSFYPLRLAISMGIKDEATARDLANNLTLLRTYINLFALRVNSYAVPNVLNLYKRHMWLTQNIFLDREDVEKAQLYVFNPKGFYKYVETEGAGKLALDDLGVIESLDDIKTLGDALLDAIVFSEDIGVMSGDIIKAYGLEKLFRLASIPEDFKVIPVYDTNALMQIHNLTLVNTSNSTNLSIIQTGTGTIKQDGVISTSEDLKSRIINFGYAEPTPADMVEATRLTVLTGPDNSIICGSEVVTDLTIYTSACDGKFSANHWNDDNLKSPYYTINGNPKLLGGTGTSDYTKVKDSLLFVALLSNFHWAPSFMLCMNNGGAKPYSDFIFIGDMHTYTIISASQLQALHTACLTGEYGIQYSLGQMNG